MSENVVAFRPAPPPQSQHEKYPLAFFNADTPSTWDIEPTGNYSADIATGQRHAQAFLQTYDGTVGWVSLLPEIVSDMVRAGTNGTFADGHPKVNGVVIGFMGVISRAVAMLCMVTTKANIAMLMDER